MIEGFVRFQTFIVGLLGFTGVILTIRMNARSARQQHGRQVKHERQALRTALRAELEIIRAMYADRISTTGDHESQQSVLVPLHVPDRVYQQLLDRIGLLTAAEVEATMKAYLLVAELPTRLGVLADTTVESRYPGYVRIPGRNVGHVSKLHASFIESIDLALKLLIGELSSNAIT
ncbi:hypothetical protein HNQ60_005111 [Povalibacter uvarum]|uniref:Uncharacterized protein n=1 Tax=Povalibacter uvarum TaxID=732238 RepID=A0A841HVA6_9GAMM|nr:hypothetical protein [Povalibacter uvarum]MBB6096189.1 hypothetical protein [Povalibacter uvarum]